jgi:hypothetical protein
MKTRQVILHNQNPAEPTGFFEEAVFLAGGDTKRMQLWWAAK